MTNATRSLPSLRLRLRRAMAFRFALAIPPVVALLGLAACASPASPLRKEPSTMNTSPSVASSAPSTPPAASPCSSPEAGALDFWVGEWELDSRSRVAPGKDEWVDGKASNRVRKVLEGCALLEEFDGRPAEDFRGMSLSIFDTAAKVWRQTWVDTTGSYMEFRGRSEPGRFVFEREIVVDGKPVGQRMVFHDIAADRLTWDWEKSFDGGATWELQWRLGYRRKG